MRFQPLFRPMALCLALGGALSGAACGSSPPPPKPTPAPAAPVATATVAEAPPPDPVEPEPEPDPKAEAVMTAVSEAFGDAVVVVEMKRPYWLEGDFNGDKGADLAVVVDLVKPATDLAKGTVLQSKPYNIDPSGDLADAANAGRPYFLAIVHGAKGGWSKGKPKQKVLLFGSSPILVLDRARKRSENGEFATVLSKKKKPAPPKAAKGDALQFPTQAAEGMLFWNGKKYVWEEAAGGE